MAKAVLRVALWLVLALPLAAFSADRSNPAWHQLTPEQQRILAPIQGEWVSLDATHKRKWLGITQRFPKMSADEQERLQHRMKEWASLSPAQRQAAREKYREFEQLTPAERQAIRDKWDKFKQEQAAREAAAKAAAEAEAQAKAAETDGAGKVAESAATESGTATSLRPQ
ncbi:MAG TPA: DUF3106 domain-containing protein [Burkholderiales bacterium]|jgi:hypothetical protein|nr:DUF3106 domain-containing protein [Burkholderiales bacterium]